VQPEFSAASLPELIDTLVWGLLAFCLLSYFIGSYLFEVLAQKLGEPRWMAWVPIANLYLALRLLGWGNLFWMLLAGYGVGLLGILLPAPLSMIAALAIIPTALAGVVVGFVYWPMLARRRDLPIWVGLLLVLPQFALMPLEFLVSETALFALSMAMSAVAFAAFLWIVFHDGAPEAPPHPIGFVLTGFGALVGVVLALKLPVWLEESGAIEQMQVALAQASQASLDGTSTEESEDFAALLAMFGDEAAAAANPDAKPEEAEPARTDAGEPAPHPVADSCPPEHREAGARPPFGREWWCEIETQQGWVRDGPARRWMHARAVEEEGAYRHGKRHGTWTRYWRTGGRHTQAEFSDGAQHGWMHRWDEAGRLEQQTWFENGEPAPLATPGV
jgi:hypothetical protein